MAIRRQVVASCRQSARDRDLLSREDRVSSASTSIPSFRLSRGDRASSPSSLVEIPTYPGPLSREDVIEALLRDVHAWRALTRGLALRRGSPWRRVKTIHRFTGFRERTACRRRVGEQRSFSSVIDQHAFTSRVVQPGHEGDDFFGNTFTGGWRFAAGSQRRTWSKSWRAKVSREDVAPSPEQAVHFMPVRPSASCTSPRMTLLSREDSTSSANTTSELSLSTFGTKL